MAERLKVYITRGDGYGLFRLVDIKIDDIGDTMDAIRFWGVETEDGHVDTSLATGNFVVDDDDAYFLVTVPEPVTPDPYAELFPV